MKERKTELCNNKIVFHWQNVQLLSRIKCVFLGTFIFEIN